MTLNATVAISGFRTVPQNAREWNNFFREQFQAAITGSVTLADMAAIATDTVIGRSTAGTGTPELITVTAVGRALIDDATVTAQRATLGLTLGTSGATVPLLSTANTWTLSQTFSAPPVVPSYTVAGVPSAAIPAQMAYISNESGGAVLAFSDGTNWRRVTDRAIIS